MAFHLTKKRTKGFSVGTADSLTLLIWLAEQKGFFSDEKVNIKVKAFPYSRKAMDLMLEGKLECAALVETNLAYLGYLKPKIPVKCFASVERRSADCILLRHEKGQQVTPEDIKEKRMGFMPRTTSHSFLMRFIREYNLKKADIKLTPLSPQSMPGALIRGDVEAISIWQPHTHNTMHAMDELGIPYTQFANTGFYNSEVVLAAPKPFLIKNENQVRQFIKALMSAENYYNENQAEVSDLLGLKLKVSGKVHREVWEQFEPKIRPIGEEYMKSIEMLAEWIRAEDTEFLGQNMPDYADFIDNEIFFDIFNNDVV